MTKADAKYVSSLPRVRRLSTTAAALIAASVLTSCGSSQPAAVSSGRIAPSTAITLFADTGFGQPNGISTGPDDALWFTDRSTPEAIGRITTSGHVTHFTDASLNNPIDITAGPDGALWFTNSGTRTDSNGSIGRVSTTGVISNFTDPRLRNPEGITKGPDGNLWFTNDGGNSIGRITPAGGVTIYPIPKGGPADQPDAITTGPDGNLWFTIIGSDTGSIGSITRPKRLSWRPRENETVDKNAAIAPTAAIARFARHTAKLAAIERRSLGRVAERSQARMALHAPGPTQVEKAPGRA